jgi:hypothetical protein
VSETPDAAASTAPLREPDYQTLDPSRLRLVEDESGCVRLVVEADRTYLEVKAVRTFPLSDPDVYVGFLDARCRDRVIGMVPDPRELDPESRRILGRLLHAHYFIPTILTVVKLTEEFGAVYFDVETDRGPRHFVAKGVRDAIEELGDGELLIPDADGNRYRIADWRRLDARSRRLLERVI